MWITKKVTRDSHWIQCVELGRQSVSLKQHCWKFGSPSRCIVMTMSGVQQCEGLYFNIWFISVWMYVYVRAYVHLSVFVYIWVFLVLPGIRHLDYVGYMEGLIRRCKCIVYAYNTGAWQKIPPLARRPYHVYHIHFHWNLGWKVFSEVEVNIAMGQHGSWDRLAPVRRQGSAWTNDVNLF